MEGVAAQQEADSGQQWAEALQAHCLALQQENADLQEQLRCACMWHSAYCVMRMSGTGGAAPTLCIGACWTAKANIVR